MLILLRSLRKKLLENRRFSNYILYALGEIILVVLGILIALQVNNWNDARLQRQKNRQVYASIQRQIQTDRQQLLEVIQYNALRHRAYERGNTIIGARDTSLTDSLALYAMLLGTYSDFQREGSVYASLAAGGQLEQLNNPEITRALQDLDMTYTFANNLESMHWDMIVNELSAPLRSTINYSTQRAVRPELLYGLEIQNFFVESIILTGYKEGVYQKALTEIDSLLARIDLELDP